MNPLFKLISFTLLLLSTFANASSSEQTYQLDTGDTISIQVYGEEDLSIKIFSLHQMVTLIIPILAESRPLVRRQNN